MNSLYLTLADTQIERSHILNIDEQLKIGLFEQVFDMELLEKNRF